MKKLSLSLLAKQVTDSRKEKKITQQQLSDLTGINRAMLSRLESQDYTPSIPQLEKLGEVLDFEPISLFVNMLSVKHSSCRNRICRIIHCSFTGTT